MFVFGGREPDGLGGWCAYPLLMNGTRVRTNDTIIEDGIYTYEENAVDRRSNYSLEYYLKTNLFYYKNNLISEKKNKSCQSLLKMSQNFLNISTN